MARLAWLALACLACLASDRPRSPCLHLATTARPPSAAGRRGAPLLLLLVQARRARPMRGEVSQARQGLVSTPKPLIYTSQVLRGETVFFFSRKTRTLEKSDILGCFFERNPLPGCAPARHLEPDALILARFGAVRGQISHKTNFSENYGATF